MAYLYCYDDLYQPTNAERQEAAGTLTILDGPPLARTAVLWGIAFFVAEIGFQEQIEKLAGER
jgi:hypothetical protein